MKQGLKIVFEDEWLIVVEKPSGMLTMATDKGREVTAYSMLYDYVIEEAQQGNISRKNRDFVDKVCYIQDAFKREAKGGRGDEAGVVWNAKRPKLF